jgi:hypothetical protein
VSAGRTRLCVGWFTLHFFFITVFAVRDLVSGQLGNSEVLPAWSGRFWRKAEAATSTILGERLSASSPIRQGIAAYANAAGIEAGYSYFAPSVPGSHKLVFELHYVDGRVEYDVPHVAGAAAGYRLTTLLDMLQQFHYHRLREEIVKMLVYAAWQKHPDATMIRAAFAVVKLPTMVEFRAGTRRSYDLLYSYDFRFRNKPADPAER